MEELMHDNDETLKNEEKPKNDEKPKGRPRRPMILLALAMMAIGGIGILWNDYKSSQDPAPTTVITSYEVRTYTEQTTITTSRQTTTTTSSQIMTGGDKGESRFAEYIASLLQSLERAMQTRTSNPR